MSFFRTGAAWCMATLVVTLAGTALGGEPRDHDGFYLRLGLGLGYGADSVSSDPLPIIGGDVTVNPHGFGGVTEVAAGYTVTEGLVVGGGVYSLWFSPSASKVTVRGASASGTIDFDASSFHVIGPFIDYYLNADEGLHLQAGLGLALLSLGGSRIPTLSNVRTGSSDGSGFGLMLGVGDEWWVSDGWSLGVSGRLTMGFMSGDIDVGVADADASHTAFAPAVLFTATMN